MESIFFHKATYIYEQYEQKVNNSISAANTLVNYVSEHGWKEDKNKTLAENLKKYYDNNTSFISDFKKLYKQKINKQGDIDLQGFGEEMMRKTGKRGLLAKLRKKLQERAAQPAQQILNEIAERGLKKVNRLVFLLESYCWAYPNSDTMKYWTQADRKKKYIHDKIQNFIESLITDENKINNGSFLMKILIQWKEYVKNIPENKIDGTSQIICRDKEIKINNPPKFNDLKEMNEYNNIEGVYDYMIRIVAKKIGGWKSIPNAYKDAYMDLFVKIIELWINNKNATKIKNVDMEKNELLKWAGKENKLMEDFKKKPINECVNAICENWCYFKRLQAVGSKMFLNIRSVEDIKKFKLNIIELIKCQTNRSKFSVNWDIKEKQKIGSEVREPEEKQEPEEEDIFNRTIIQIDNDYDY